MRRELVCLTRGEDGFRRLTDKREKMRYKIFMVTNQGYALLDTIDNLYFRPTKDPWRREAWWWVNLENLIQNFYTLVGKPVDFHFTTLGIEPYKENPWG